MFLEIMLSVKKYTKNFNLVSIKFYSIANKLGIIKVREGTAIIKATLMKSDVMKGTTPLKVSIMGTSLAMELMTKTFRPTGGVMSPISTTINEMMPNHSLRSSPSNPNPKSRPAIIGQKMGTVSKIMDKLSMTKPNKI